MSVHSAATRRAVIRADASVQIGGGHIQRCLTLAGELGVRGWQVRFVVNAEAPDAVPLLKDVDCVALPPGSECRADVLMACAPMGCDLLVVDHYGLQASYESACRPWASRIMVVDDLADRQHDCDFLLDQTFCREAGDYRPLVPADCRLLLGSGYALLRPEFARLRAESLARPRTRIRRVFVSMGSTDPLGLTGPTLRVLGAVLPQAEADVVMGERSFGLEDVRAIVARRPDWRLHVQTRDVARLMASADLAIGAAGSTSWERCCLGVPCVMLIAAANQEKISKALADAGAAVVLDARGNVAIEDALAAELAVLSSGGWLSRFAEKAADICDGLGAGRVIDAIIGGPS